MTISKRYPKNVGAERGGGGDCFTAPDWRKSRNIDIDNDNDNDNEYVELSNAAPAGAPAGASTAMNAATTNMNTARMDDMYRRVTIPRVGHWISGLPGVDPEKFTDQRNPFFLSAARMKIIGLSQSSSGSASASSSASASASVAQGQQQQYYWRHGHDYHGHYPPERGAGTGTGTSTSTETGASTSTSTGTRLIELTPSLVLKFGPNVVLSEAANMQYVRSKTRSVPVPRVYDAFADPSTGINYILMERIVPRARNLGDMWPELSTHDKVCIADQLRGMFDELRSLVPPSRGYMGGIGLVGSSVGGSGSGGSGIDGGLQDLLFQPMRNRQIRHQDTDAWIANFQVSCIDPAISGPFESESALNSAILHLLGQLLSEPFMELIRDMVGKTLVDHVSVFTHGDLTVGNILVDSIPVAVGSTGTGPGTAGSGLGIAGAGTDIGSPVNRTQKQPRIVGVLGWKAAGWYPEYWEYSNAAIRSCWFPEWFELVQHVLQRYPTEYVVMDKLRGLLRC
ncbi:hypothetical protein L228DRAFT_236404 [Xylona heveae TC161]|uniref:Aminoglycoside phosphotransferase domain-containing protein n=1 Tax=Xylona heveae (strain CBS 132557 / TC161) TaxID=1328760 RepID=A0A165IRP9_XYLHT|nr:hypothetical protein L228DRAFT_236404 [Xylona heveae TC161]KZF25289.1 hypothetical protein L228DRAFT_236404 [Xylona heveae TC161]